MKLSPDDFEETVHVAREYLQAGYSAADDALLCRDFAEVIVKIADSCVVGARCDRHYGAVHGQEAEELRAGVEQILRNTSGVRDEDAAFVLAELRKSLLFLLDHVDARDSLAFREATDPKDPAAGEEESPTDTTASDEEAYRRRGADRRAFFAALSPGDKISWGIERAHPRSGVIQKIEDEYVTILDDGWPADPPLCDYTPPFVERLRIDHMLHLSLVEKAASCT